MASQKQIAANRQNAQKSTGPRTPEGRLASSRNALRHGLAARDLVVSIEEQAEFEEMLQVFEAELQPAGTLELAVFSQIVAAQWRLRRIETGYFEVRLANCARELKEDDSQLEGAHQLGLVVQHDAAGSNALANLPATNHASSLLLPRSPRIGAPPVCPPRTH